MVLEMMRVLMALIRVTDRPALEARFRQMIILSRAIFVI